MSLKSAIREFDFESYIEEKFDSLYPTGQPYRVRTHCPFCSDEKTGHFYIHVPHRLVYCQKCKYDPRWLPQFLADMEDISVSEAISQLDSRATGLLERRSIEDLLESLYDQGEEEEVVEYEAFQFGSEFISLLEDVDIPPLKSRVQAARDYLHQRGVDDFLIRKYDIRYCYDGQFSGRIVIPTYHKGEVVTFVARDLSGFSSRKYLNPTKNKQGDFLFNYDSVKGDQVVVAEGVFDAIAIGDDAVASFGKSLTHRQVDLLSRFREVIFYWDDDAYEQVERYAGRLSGIVKTVLHPDERDAGDRTYKENRKMIEDAVCVSSVAATVFSLRH